jgi:hypothetical protein
MGGQTMFIYTYTHDTYLVQCTVPVDKQGCTNSPSHVIVE